MPSALLAVAAAGGPLQLKQLLQRNNAVNYCSSSSKSVQGRRGAGRRCRACAAGASTSNSSTSSSSSSSSSSRSFPIKAAENGAPAVALVDRPSAPPPPAAPARPSWSSSNFIGFGCLLDDESLFRERFVIRFSEAGPRGTITLETLSSLLQEAATNHVMTMDYPFTPGKNLEGNITVITRMHIEVDHYPAWRDLLEVDTWFQREGKYAVRRDWIVKDVSNGQTIAVATSTWVLMNTHTRRLSRLTEEQWAKLNPHMRHPARCALSDERREISSKKILKLGENAPYRISGLMASEKDTDMNQHVNNIRYMSWMLESIPEEVRSTHEVSKITVEFRQEAVQGQAVESMAEPEEEEFSIDCSLAARQFAHLVQTSEVGKEINRGRTVWKLLQ